MASTFSHSGTTVDRKSLKRPDGFTSAITGLFNDLSKQTGLLLVFLGALLGLGVLAALYMNHLDSRSEAARNALFSGDKAMETEMKALATAESPKALKDSADKIAPEALAETVAYKKLDVDRQFPETVKKLQEVDATFGNTRSAYEARLKLGDLYYNHSEFSKAVPWYEKASDTAPNNFEKAVAFSSLGYTQENLGKPSEAIQAFQKALNLGEGSLKGDLLLGLARSYEAMHDSANARSTYDRILSELPNTDSAKSAEIFKSQIH